MKKILLFLTVILTFPLAHYCYAENGFSPKDRELLLELRVKMGEIDKRFEQIDKRFEQIDKRFEELRQDMNKRFDELRQDMNKRFEDLRQDMNKRFEMLVTFLWMITAIFTTLTFANIGFAYWDRRTIIRKAKEETVSYMETDGLTHKMLVVLRELSKEDKKVANVLRQFNLL